MRQRHKNCRWLHAGARAEQGALPLGECCAAWREAGGAILPGRCFQPMRTPKKNRPAAPDLSAAKQQRKRVVAAEPEIATRTDVGGKLPGDDKEDLYWEDRVAAWLGVPRKRIASLRRRGLREGEHWISHAQGIVYTVAGLQRLRDYLGSLGELTPPTKEPSALASEPPAPVGPPEKMKVIIAKLYPNTRLMLAVAEGSTPEKPVQVLVRVRDNRNFMPGMKVPVVHDPRNSSWQFVGRLPRRRGRLLETAKQ